MLMVKCALNAETFKCENYDFFLSRKQSSAAVAVPGAAAVTLMQADWVTVLVRHA